MSKRIFHIHGDNIIECERFLTVLQEVFTGASFSDPSTSLICPYYEFTKNSTHYRFQFLPGFQNTANTRWNKNILDIIQLRGGPLREAADILLTEIVNNEEHPLLAIEFCSALPAGNQAWQRSGRSYSYGKAKIPILYVVDIGGHELSATRSNKNIRLPSSAVTFSYISFSNYNESLVSQIFLCNYGTTPEIREKFKHSFGKHHLIQCVSDYIFQGYISDNTLAAIQKSQLKFILNNVPERTTSNKFSQDQWKEFYNIINKNQDILQFINKNPIKKWGKKINIEQTDTLKEHLELASTLGVGITQSDLPFCYISKNNRQLYAEKLKKIYKERISNEFYTALISNTAPLVICWIAGFKPRGDDSRPDRGLLPLCRMLLGSEIEIITIIYGPATDKTLQTLSTSPRSLLANGLWEAIFECSDYILVDSVSAKRLTNISWTKSHWYTPVPHNNTPKLYNINFPYITPYPKRFSENDVDSLIHNVFKKLELYNSCFEASCNPPGGDWSGISYVNRTDNTEYRWLTLPRVSKHGYKRPDHVIQIFSSPFDYLLSIESKNYAKDIEADIGPRLTDYVKLLFSSPCNASRSHKDNNWSNTIFTINTKKIIHVSGIAFLLSPKEQILDAEKRSNADLSFIITFTNGEEKLLIKPLTLNGQLICTILRDKMSLFLNDIFKIY